MNGGIKIVKLDLVKDDKTYYSAKIKPQLVEIDECIYLTINGSGDPNGQLFKDKTSGIYQFAYAIKKICKNHNKDFVVPKLEGLWWLKEGEDPFIVSRSNWLWKLLIRMPDFVTLKMFEHAKNDILKKSDNAHSAEIKFEKIAEGKSVQVLHIGPYSSEPETIKKMKNFMNLKGYLRNGFHHEIYLSDPRKSAPNKMKTILRQPVK